MLIGYARVSTEDQLTRPQVEELRAVGCDETHLEHASSVSRARPVLGHVLKHIRPATSCSSRASTASPARSAIPWR